MASSNLQAHLAKVRKAAERLPEVAAKELERLTARTQQEQAGPDGERWAPVMRGKDTGPAKGAKYDEVAKRWRIRGRFATGAQLAGLGAFDPSNHIQYKAFRDSQGVGLRCNHPAARYTRFGTKHMVARPKVPNGQDDSLWLDALLVPLRKTLGGRG